MITLLVLGFLLLLSAFFSATETAYTSLRPSLLRIKGEKNPKRMALAIKLHSDFDTLITTILTLNNFIYLLAASIATAFFISHFHSMGTTISVAVMTVVTLLFAEVTPKSLAAEAPERFALFSAPLLRFFILLCTPFTWFFARWRKLVNLLYKSNDERAFSEDELMDMVDKMEEKGNFNEDDMELIQNAIEFKDLLAEDVITPRVKIEGIEKDATLEDITDKFLTTGFSRIPVYDDTIDSIVGIVHLRDFFNHVMKKDKQLAEIITMPVYVAPTMEITELFKELQRKKSHIAVVMDEHGGTAGIVTVEDILEKLVGDIWDESDDIVEEFIKLDDNQYRVICEAYIDKFFGYFELDEENEEIHAQTVNGWIMDSLGKIPEPGDSFEFNNGGKNLHISIHTMESHKVVDCIVTVTDILEDGEGED